MPTTTATSFELPFYSVSFGVLGIGTITLVWFLVRDWSNKKERLRRRRKFAALVMNGNANSAQEKEGGDSRLVDSGTRRETAHTSTTFSKKEPEASTSKLRTLSVDPADDNSTDQKKKEKRSKERRRRGKDKETGAGKTSVKKSSRQTTESPASQQISLPEQVYPDSSPSKRDEGEPTPRATVDASLGLELRGSEVSSQASVDGEPSSTASSELDRESQFDTESRSARTEADVEGEGEVDAEPEGNATVMEYQPVPLPSVPFPTSHRTIIALLSLKTQLEPETPAPAPNEDDESYFIPVTKSKSPSKHRRKRSTGTLFSNPNPLPPISAFPTPSSASVSQATGADSTRESISTLSSSPPPDTPLSGGIDLDSTPTVGVVSNSQSLPNGLGGSAIDSKEDWAIPEDDRPLKSSNKKGERIGLGIGKVGGGTLPQSVTLPPVWDRSVDWSSVMNGAPSPGAARSHFLQNRPTAPTTPSKPSTSAAEDPNSPSPPAVHFPTLNQPPVQTPPSPIFPSSTSYLPTSSSAYTYSSLHHPAPGPSSSSSSSSLPSPFRSSSTHPSNTSTTTSIDAPLQTQIASLKGALEAARIREEKCRNDADTFRREVELLRWRWSEEGGKWRRREGELQAHIHYLMSLQVQTQTLLAPHPGPHMQTRHSRQNSLHGLTSPPAAQPPPPPLTSTDNTSSAIPQFPSLNPLPSSSNPQSRSNSPFPLTTSTQTPINPLFGPFNIGALYQTPTPPQGQSPDKEDVRDSLASAILKRPGSIPVPGEGRAKSRNGSRDAEKGAGGERGKSALETLPPMPGKVDNATNDELRSSPTEEDTTPQAIAVSEVDVSSTG